MSAMDLKKKKKKIYKIGIMTIFYVYLLSLLTSYNLKL